MSEQEKQREGVGSVIGIIIIIIVLLIGALYMAEQRIKKSKEFQESLINPEASSTVMFEASSTEE